MTILAIDPSLTATGVALLHDDCSFTVDTIRSKPDGIRITDVLRRFNSILDQIPWDRTDIELCVIEAPAFSKNDGRAHERAGFWWNLAEWACSNYDNVIAIKPNLRTKYATGSGNAGKDEVMLAAAKRYPQADITDNNNADAVILAAMGARLLGHPIEKSLPQANLDAMKTLAMPSQ